MKTHIDGPRVDYPCLTGTELLQSSAEFNFCSNKVPLPPREARVLQDRANITCRYHHVIIICFKM
jgi:hypothetical protein